MPRDNPSCTITTSLGNFTAEIFLRQMPLTAANFIDLVEKRFYDGTHVHLLAPKMVLGMGCPHSKDPHSSKAGTGAAPDGPPAAAQRLSPSVAAPALAPPSFGFCFTSRFST